MKRQPNRIKGVLERICSFLAMLETTCKCIASDEPVKSDHEIHIKEKQVT